MTVITCSNMLVAVLLAVDDHAPLQRDSDSSTSASAADEPGPAHRIAEVWAAREQRLETLIVTWESKCTYTKQAMYALTPEELRETIPSDLTISVQPTLQIKNGMFRLDRIDLNFGTILRREPQRAVFSSAFDGSLDYHITFPGDGSAPEAVEFVETSWTELGNIYLRAIILHSRPVSGMHFVPGDYEVVRDDATLNDRRCVVLAGRPERFPPGKCLDEYWIDQDRDNTILRWKCRNDSVQIDIEYVSDAIDGWRPAAWSATFFNSDGTVREGEHATVIDWKAGARIGDDVFRIKYPPGTSLFDHKSFADYVIEADGSRKLVRAHERPGSRLGRSGPPASRSGTSWLLIANAIVVFVGWIIFRKRRRHADGTP